MYKRISAILMPIALVAAIGLGVWGYQVNNEKNLVLIKAENQYQRSFQDLTFHMDQLQTELGNMIAVTPSTQHYYRRQTINIWRITNQAKNEITQLPLTLLPFDKSQELLHNLATFAYQTSIRDLDKKPLTNEEIKTMKSLFERSKNINKDLQKVQQSVLSKSLRWMDVEVALASQKENTDNVIIDGFKTLNKKVEGYSEVDYGPSSLESKKSKNLNNLPGKMVSAQDVRKKAADFLQISNATGLKIKENGAGTELNTYTVTGSSSKEEQVYLDFSKKGGHLLQFMRPRNISQKVLDLAGAREAGEDFLNEHGYADMVAVNFDEYANTAAITFAHRREGVVIYPEAIMLNVAMDNGDITDMRTAEYYLEGQEKQPIAEPKLTEAEAKKELNSNFKVASINRAVIESEINERVPCYQFLGKINDENYKVFINSDTGYEEKVENLR
ncbi:MAG: germination protein YpeB [Gorillibacterium sp.]|nr:germination protein YpeB [Gorillibacterium sp.]